MGPGQGPPGDFWPARAFWPKMAKMIIFWQNDQKGSFLVRVGKRTPRDLGSSGILGLLIKMINFD